MTELSDKVKGWTMSTIGTLGIIAGITSITNDPKKILGYTGAIASAACLSEGVNYLKKTYNNYEKIKGKVMTAVGTGGVLSGMILIADDPKKILGYTGAIASAACLSYGLDKLKENPNKLNTE
jgi:threonine dehydratase